MDIPQIITAIGVVASIVLTFVLRIHDSRQSARKEELAASQIRKKDEETERRLARQSEVDLLRGELDRLQLRQERQDTMIANQDAEIAGLRTENTTLHKQMSLLMGENERLRGDNRNLQEQIDDLRKELIRVTDVSKQDSA